MLDAIISATALGLVLGITAIGVYITFRIMNISDLSVDGTFALGGFVSVALILGEFTGILSFLNSPFFRNPFVTLIFAALGGAVAGMWTGFLQTKLKIPAILSGILTMTGLYSINLRILGTSNKNIMKDDTVFTMLRDITSLSRNVTTILISLLIIVIIIIILYWFFGTEIGSAIRATGSNEQMAQALGVSTDITKIIGLGISNGLVALSGALYSQNQRVVDIKQGTGMIVTGLASIIIGAFFIRKGNFAVKLSGTVIGAVIYRIAIGVVIQLGLNTNDQQLITSLMVTTVLAVPIVSEFFRRVFNVPKKPIEKHVEVE